jgi:hypothetical protein
VSSEEWMLSVVRARDYNLPGEEPTAVLTVLTALTVLTTYGDLPGVEPTAGLTARTVLTARTELTTYGDLPGVEPTAVRSDRSSVARLASATHSAPPIASE